MKYGKFLPHVVAILAFIAISAAYFAPQFSGQTLRQGDVIQYNGTTQDILEHRETYGEDPQWAGNVFSGMSAVLVNMKQDGMLIRQAGKAFNFLGEPASMIFIAMLCFYLMLLCFGINPWVAIAPALAYGLSTYFFVALGAGHITKIRVLAFAPMLVGGVYYAYRRNMWIGAALAGISASLTITHNHLQIVYYFLFIIAALVINEFVRAYKEKILPRFAKTTAFLALAALLAAGSNFSLLYYIRDHTPETIRGGSELAGSQTVDRGLDLEYATSWSYGVGETFNLLIPNLYGGASDLGFSSDGEVAEALAPYGAQNLAAQLPTYWGDQPVTSGPVYIGAVVIFTAVLGLFLLRRRKTLWISVLAAIAVLLAWGHNFMWFTELFYDYFPFYNKFRTVSMILVIVEWCVPVLAALTLQKLWCGEIDRRRFYKRLEYATGIVGGIILLLLVFGGSIFSFSGPVDIRMAENMPPEVMEAMRSERASMLRADCLRSLLFVLAAAATVWFFYVGRLKKWAFATLLVVLVSWDMIPVNLRFMGRDRFVPESQTVIRPTEADRQILADTEPGFRVINLTVDPFNDGTTSYFHRSLGGYHGAKLSRYQDLIEHQLSRNNAETFNMLNTKYFITADASGQPQARLNPDANGAAWFVDEIMTVDGAAAEMSALDTVNTKTTAVVDTDFDELLAALPAEAGATAADSAAWIRIEEYRANYQSYRYFTELDNVAVFSEIYYPKGWTAYIDGAEAPYFRADYVLRAMVLPAGEHTVEFRFRAPGYEKLTTVNLICSLILIAGAAGSVLWVVIRKKRKEDDCGRE